MRIVTSKILLLTLALVGGRSGLDACGGYTLEPDTIKYPGRPQWTVVRGDHLLSVNDAGRVIAVDLKRAKTFDLGPAKDRRWSEGDVADGQAMWINKQTLQVVSLQDAKVVHEVVLSKDQVWAFGFAGKGKAFLHRGYSLDILELATGKTLHTVDLGKDDQFRGRSAWQKVGSKLYVVGASTTICVIDLDTGKLADRFAVEARAGIATFHVEHSLIYCIGFDLGFTWVPNNHLACFDMQTKKTLFCDFDRSFRRGGRLASGPYGTCYVVGEGRIQRYTMAGDVCGAFKTPGDEPVLAVWHNRALVAAKDQIKLIEINETPVARK